MDPQRRELDSYRPSRALSTDPRNAGGINQDERKMEWSHSDEMPSNVLRGNPLPSKRVTSVSPEGSVPRHTATAAASDRSEGVDSYRPGRVDDPYRREWSGDQGAVDSYRPGRGSEVARIDSYRPQRLAEAQSIDSYRPLSTARDTSKRTASGHAKTCDREDLPRSSDDSIQRFGSPRRDPGNISRVSGKGGVIMTEYRSQGYQCPRRVREIDSSMNSTMYSGGKRQGGSMEVKTRDPDHLRRVIVSSGGEDGPGKLCSGAPVTAKYCACGQRQDVRCFDPRKSGWQSSQLPRTPGRYEDEHESRETIDRPRHRNLRDGELIPGSYHSVPKWQYESGGYNRPGIQKQQTNISLRGQRRAHGDEIVPALDADISFVRTNMRNLAVSAPTVHEGHHIKNHRRIGHDSGSRGPRGEEPVRGRWQDEHSVKAEQRQAPPSRAAPPLPSSVPCELGSSAPKGRSKGREVGDARGGRVAMQDGIYQAPRPSPASPPSRSLKPSITPVTTTNPKKLAEKRRRQRRMEEKRLGLDPGELTPANIPPTTGRKQRARERRERTQNAPSFRLIGGKEAVSEDNAGFQLLKQMGWKEGEALGRENGIKEPVMLRVPTGRRGLTSERRD